MSHERLTVREAAQILAIKPASLTTLAGQNLRRALENKYPNPKQQILEQLAHLPEDLSRQLDLFPDISLADAPHTWKTLSEHTKHPKIMALFELRNLIEMSIPEEDLRAVVMHVAKTDTERFLEWYGAPHCNRPWIDCPHWIEIEKLTWLTFDQLRWMYRDYYGNTRPQDQAWPERCCILSTTHPELLGWWLRSCSVAPMISVIGDHWHPDYEMITLSRNDVERFPEIIQRATELFTITIKEPP